ncbi:MAG: YfjI family protein [Bacteroidota bacterium]|nr:YfjI family protein [Bacteroidota bacterium]
MQDGAAAFPDKRKRDVFFTGAVAILSGCLPKVTGVYFQERVYPHIFAFIIAPAGNGKGVLKNAKRLASKYDDKIIAKSRQEQKIYEAELAEYKREASARGKKEPLGDKPEAPPFKLLFIPANCSTSRMLEHLQQNGGSGIICETEADTMSGAKKQDWGDYSPILRAAFHAEEISLSRKTNNELIKIAEPRLAITLTGTPAQAPRLIGSSEDGLFSRFLFYAFKSEHVWQDPSPKSQPIVHNDHFEALSLQVLNMIEFLETSPTNVQLYPHQWEILNATFTNILSDVTTFTSEEASGVVYRLGLIQFRFCIIFTALRKFENAEIVDSLFCIDEDFNTALTIIKTYLQHSLLMFNNLPGQADAMQFKAGDGKRKFIDALPQNFTRKEAV